MRKLVVVDRDQSNCHLLREIAAACGWEMRGCRETVAEGLALIERERPDCVISDFWFGESETGLDLIARAKAIDPRIHAVIFTGWNLRDIAEAPLSSVADVVLRKPSSSHALMELLDAIPERPERITIRATA